MKEIASTVHKCLKFPHNDKFININHSIFQPTMRRGDVCLDYFLFEQFKPLEPRSDALFRSYQKWKNEMILSLRKPRNPTLSMPLDDHIPLLEDNIVLPKKRNSLLPKETSIPSPNEKNILSPKKRDIPLPNKEPIPSPMDESPLPPKNRKNLPPKKKTNEPNPPQLSTNIR